MPRTRMESRRITEKERKKDNMEQKKREENEIPGVIASQESFQEPVKNRSKLVLPSPQISELEEGPSHIDPESSFQGAPRGGVASKEELKEKVKSLDKQMESASYEHPRIRAKMLERKLNQKYTMLFKVRKESDFLEVELRAIERKHAKLSKTRQGNTLRHLELQILERQIKTLKRKEARQARKRCNMNEEICTLYRELADIPLLFINYF